MLTDSFDQSVTTQSRETIEAFNRFGRDWLSYGTNLPVIFAAAAADPDAALVQAYAGALHMALEAQPGIDAAQPFLEAARARAAYATAREQSIIRGIDLWAQGQPHAAARHFLCHVREHPADIVAAKWGQYLSFNVGASDLMLAIAEAALPAHRSLAHAHGMHAFGLEQTHRLEAAEEAGRQSLALDPTDAWAQHAIAHVMETQGRVEEGIAFMSAHSAGWASRSIFMREHNWWHIALFHLDRDEPKRALAIFDEHLWGTWPEFGQEQIGAVSALWRLELRGVDAGPRWRKIAAKIAERGPEQIWPFHTMHYVYGLARGGETAALKDQLRALDHFAHGLAEGEQKTVWRDVALPLARGIVAHAEGRMAAAADLIKPALPRLEAIGGSHAQRDIFQQTWIDAAIRAGETAEASQMLARRLNDRPNIPVTRRLLALCGPCAA